MIKKVSPVASPMITASQEKREADALFSQAEAWLSQR